MQICIPFLSIADLESAIQIKNKGSNSLQESEVTEGVSVDSENRESDSGAFSEQIGVYPEETSAGTASDDFAESFEGADEADEESVSEEEPTESAESVSFESADMPDEEPVSGEEFSESAEEEPSYCSEDDPDFESFAGADDAIADDTDFPAFMDDAVEDEQPDFGEGEQSDTELADEEPVDEESVGEEPDMDGEFATEQEQGETSVTEDAEQGEPFEVTSDDDFDLDSVLSVDDEYGESRVSDDDFETFAQMDGYSERYVQQDAPEIDTTAVVPAQAQALADDYEDDYFFSDTLDDLQVINKSMLKGKAAFEKVHISEEIVTKSVRRETTIVRQGVDGEVIHTSIVDSGKSGKPNKRITSDTSKTVSDSAKLSSDTEGADKIQNAVSEVAEPKKEPAVELPPTFIEYVRQNPNCDVKVAGQYYSKKEIQAALLVGRVIKKKGKYHL